MQVGDKVRGFEFEETEHIEYAYRMGDRVGEVGKVHSIYTDEDSVELQFSDSFRCWYPLSLAEQHIVKEKVLLSDNEVDWHEHELLGDLGDSREYRYVTSSFISDQSGSYEGYRYMKPLEVSMTLEEVREKLGISNLIIK
jgi:hypothetical protein